MTGSSPTSGAPTDSPAAVLPIGRLSGGSLWRDGAYRKYLAAQIVSLAGGAVSLVALPTLAAIEMHATSGQIAILAFLGQLPAFLIALPVGAIVDRHRKRPLMIGGDLVCAAAIAVIPLSAAAGRLNISCLYAVAFVASAGRIVHDAAAISYLPTLVEPPVLHQANSRLSAGYSVADSAGSNGGAALVAILGAARAVTADAASYLISAWWVWRIRSPEDEPTAKARRHLAAEVWEGLTYCARHPVIRSVITAISMASFASAIITTYWAYYLLTDLHYSPTALGAVMGISNAGSLAGALIAPRLAARFGAYRLMITTLLVLPVSQVPLLLAQPGRTWLFIMTTTQVVQLFAIAACGTTQRSVRQVITAREYQGRMQQVSTWTNAGSRPIAALIAGAMAGGAGIRPALCLGATLLTLPPLVLLRSPVAALQHAPPPRQAPSAGAKSSGRYRRRMFRA